MYKVALLEHTRGMLDENAGLTQRFFKNYVNHNAEGAYANNLANFVFTCSS
jgi:hypothetical protein